RERRRSSPSARDPSVSDSGTPSSATRLGKPPRCRGWQQEAAPRMRDNKLDPDVAEKPSELIVYGGIGKAARDQASLEAIKRELMRLADDETLLVQSGKPVAVFQTHELA